MNSNYMVFFLEKLKKPWKVPVEFVVLVGYEKNQRQWLVKLWFLVKRESHIKIRLSEHPPLHFPSFSSTQYLIPTPISNPERSSFLPLTFSQNQSQLSASDLLLLHSAMATTAMSSTVSLLSSKSTAFSTRTSIFYPEKVTFKKVSEWFLLRFLLFFGDFSLMQSFSYMGFGISGSSALQWVCKWENGVY